MERSFAGREIRRSILLRDAIGLQVSLYNYRMMNNLSKGLGVYSFERHLRALPRNYLSYCFLNRWIGLSIREILLMPDQQQFETIDTALRDFWFVGSYTECGKLIARLAEDLGVPTELRVTNSAEDWSRQVTWEPLRLDSLTPAMRALIIERNAVDQVLWERWGSAEARARELDESVALSRTASPTAWASLAAHELLRRVTRDYSMLGRIGQRRRVRMADAARSSENWELAARLYDRAISRGVTTPALLIELARAHARHGADDLAILAYDRALAMKRNMPDIENERARCVMNRGQVENSVSD